MKTIEQLHMAKNFILFTDKYISLKTIEVEIQNFQESLASGTGLNLLSWSFGDRSDLRCCITYLTSIDRNWAANGETEIFRWNLEQPIEDKQFQLEIKTDKDLSTYAIAVTGKDKNGETVNFELERMPN